MRYVLEERAVRGAVCAALDEASEGLAEVLRAKGLEPTRARVMARGYWVRRLLWGPRAVALGRPRA